MHRDVLLATCAALLIAGMAVFTYLHRASIPILSPQGPVALGETHVIYITALLCAIVVVPVFVMLFAFAWLYRAGHPRARHHYFPNWDHHSRAAELTWWLIPAIIIFFLSILSYQSSNALDPYKQLPGTPLTIQVVALNWKWLFIYPKEHIASVNSLVIPEDVPVHFDLTADAPINSFWIPSLGGQIMVMPGMTTQLNLMADNAGIFGGSSANISGQGFAGMAFTVRSLTPEDFRSWLTSLQHSSSSPLTAQSYAELSKPSSNNPVQYYSTVDKTLYDSIIAKYMNDGPMDMSAHNMAP